MQHALRVGFSFGLTSGVITTLGLMIGLHSGTHSKLAVIGGILTIAVADAFSDALGIHIAEESKNEHTHRGVWLATCFTFLFKFCFALTFIVPVLLFPLDVAMLVSIGWGLLLLGVLSFRIGKESNGNRWAVVGEHLLIALLVILITHFVGDGIAAVFD
ncbi:hypothetical protein COT40_01030 [Candidatus Peregrinibacteria bacterium CG08_land_8_20_14_0_20_41_10]|nr:MAG: hypothetical protein AUJ78_01515 [Candidatus Peregrinibacteria bacterium CG1_02_41_10]PIS32235.1 MAG: hypothetical protein COT40_01030 [Candidatus Peregrinibacteria bacterium CG08_land_8_20_14_0_20_41_10]